MFWILETSPWIDKETDHTPILWIKKTLDLCAALQQVTTMPSWCEFGRLPWRLLIATGPHRQRIPQKSAGELVNSLPCCRTSQSLEHAQIKPSWAPQFRSHSASQSAGDPGNCFSTIIPFHCCNYKESCTPHGYSPSGAFAVIRGWGGGTLLNAESWHFAGYF